MNSKITLIITIVVSITIISSVIGLFVYINSLNNKVSDLNNTVTEQAEHINLLNCTITSLENNLKAVNETVSITSSFIENLETIRVTDTTIKQEIYNEVVNDKESYDWFNEKLPDGILSVLSDSISTGMCKDGNTD